MRRDWPEAAAVAMPYCKDTPRVEGLFRQNSEALAAATSSLEVGRRGGPYERSDYPWTAQEWCPSHNWAAHRHDPRGSLEQAPLGAGVHRPGHPPRRHSVALLGRARYHLGDRPPHRPVGGRYLPARPPRGDGQRLLRLRPAASSTAP